MAKIGEIEKYILFTMAVDVGLFLLGAAFDPLAGKMMIQHKEGYGLGQILWMAFFGLRSVVDFYYLQYYKV